MDALAKVVPDGIYLISFTQFGNDLEIKGKSNANGQSIKIDEVS